MRHVQSNSISLGKNLSAVDINRELNEVYGTKRGEELMHQCVQYFKHGRTNIDDEVVGFLQDTDYTNETKQMGSALQFLSRYAINEDDFFNRILTGVETWVANVKIGNKQKSMNGMEPY